MCRAYGTMANKNVQKTIGPNCGNLKVDGNS